jgi:transglutaminase-like putative cysteine protease
MRVSIVHDTVYRYSSPASYSIQYLRLSPRPSRRQKVVSWRLDTPVPARPWVDGFGNDAHVLVIARPHEEIRIRARGEVEVNDAPGEGEDAGPHAPTLYLRPTPLTVAEGPLAELADGMRGDLVRDRAAGLEALMQAVRDRVDYRSGVTDAATSALEAFAARAGVCQDHAHVFVACCRRVGIPARYVSGYLAAERPGEGDAMASHAWAEAWLEGEGWRGYDVANRQRPGGRHVRVAVGLDYRDACPVRGFRRGGADESMQVEVVVSDAPRKGPKNGARSERAEREQAQQRAQQQRAQQQRAQQQQQQQQ